MKSIKACRVSRISAIVTAFVLLWLACVPPHAHGQTDAQFSQYYEVPTFYNPAATGATDYLRIRGGARLQWVGIDNAPTTFAATADMPLKLFEKRFGVGVMFDSESMGLYKSLNMGVQLGYKFRKLGGEWTAAVQIGIYDQGFKGSEVVLPDDDDYHEGTDDAIPTSDIHGTSLDLGLGVWYAHKYFQAGLSATHLNSPTVSMTAESGSGGGSESGGERKYEFQARRTLYFMAIGNIPIKNTLFELVPSLLVKSDFSFTTGELTARARWKKMLSFGIGYRWNDAVIATVGLEFKNFYAGYSYDYATSAIMKASSGSHEVFVGYSLKLDLSDKNRHRHKSIRLM